ncbi:MAG: type II toxin-antitoxin system VapC family toxin [Clostridiales Family XIII bacterium]|jgi:PIN domain nuclease of toxin-antitoxin system|nr:type II toxin-antitoxin system VapC family toxin [Clostridiales Family XIII bacterium]
MNILLDTCSLIWCLTDDARLGVRARGLIADSRNVVHVSSISFFEISIKSAIGKLRLRGVDLDKLPAVVYESGAVLIPVDPFESIALHRLPLKEGHKDPFDRMLVCQAIERSLTLVSADHSLAAYREEGLSLILG